MIWLSPSVDGPGRDGIHGATFSSLELDDTSESPRPAVVQIGNPIMEKKIVDALMEARDRQLYRNITDCGCRWDFPLLSVRWGRR